MEPAFAALEYSIGVIRVASHATYRQIVVSGTFWNLPCGVLTAF